MSIKKCRKNVIIKKKEMKRTLFKNNNHNEQSANVTMCSFAVGGAKQKMSSVIPELCIVGIVRVNARVWI